MSILSFSDICDVEVWETDNYSDTDDELSGPNFALEGVFSDEDRDLVHWMVIFLLRLQAKFYIPDAALQCLIKFLSVFLSVIGRSSSHVAHMASVFPRSLYELRNKYRLGSKFKKMAVYQMQFCI